MKIATWNVERLKRKSDLSKINLLLDELKADILVLTETDSRVSLPKYKNHIKTSPLIEIDKLNYLETENRVSIYTNYEITNHFETFDSHTSVCVELKTELGNLVVYGTIIGVYGNRNESFKTDLEKQIADFERLSSGNNFCVIGDYNISFSDNYYFTVYGREQLNKSFDKNGLALLTRNKTECIDQIALSKNFIDNYTIATQEWNEDKKLSDHKGIFVHLANKKPSNHE